MKRILFLLFVISICSSSFAQDLSVGLKAKNDGNESYRSKDYVGAIKNWEVYLNSGEEGVDADTNTKGLYVNSFKYAAIDFMKAKNYKSAYSYFEKYTEKGDAEVKKDGKTVYYMASCANKLKKSDLALSKYQKSIELGYKEDVSMFYIAKIYKKAGDEAKMIETLKEAMAKYPDSKIQSKMVAMLINPMLKEAAVPFNEANELAKAASTSEPAEYVSNMEKAVSKFSKAIPLFDEVLKLDPANDQANTYVNACKDNIKSFKDYKASLKK